MSKSTLNIYLSFYTSILRNPKLMISLILKKSKVSRIFLKVNMKKLQNLKKNRKTIYNYWGAKISQRSKEIKKISKHNQLADLLLQAQLKFLLKLKKKILMKYPLFPMIILARNGTTVILTKLEKKQSITKSVLLLLLTDHLQDIFPLFLQFMMGQ